MHRAVVIFGIVIGLGAISCSQTEVRSRVRTERYAYPSTIVASRALVPPIMVTSNCRQKPCALVIVWKEQSTGRMDAEVIQLEPDGIDIASHLRYGTNVLRYSLGSENLFLLKDKTGFVVEGRQIGTRAAGDELMIRKNGQSMILDRVFQEDDHALREYALAIARQL